MLAISFSDQKPTEGAVACGVFEGNVLSAFGQSLEAQTKGALSRGIKASYFKGKTRDVLPFLGFHSFERFVLFGLGKQEALLEDQAYEIGGALAAHFIRTPHTEMTLVLEDLAAQSVASIAFGLLLRAWAFTKHRTTLKDHEKIALQKVVISVKDPHQAEALFKDYETLAESVLWARELISEPGNILYPKTYVERMMELKSLGLTVEALDQEAMAKLGMGALLGVSQGSPQEPYLGVVQWNGGKAGEAPLAFIGKGVTFDTGGISLKPSSNMDEMKADMAGSAVVLGTLRALAARKAPVNAVAVVALVENMPSGQAQRPGDIVTSMSGQTIEVLNTDAEGRLILADALYYATQRFKPRFMIDVATLTGAMRAALGGEYAGVFSRHDELAEKLEQAGKQVGEKLWRLPMSAAFDRELDCPIADMQNITAPGCGAGSITAAQFLARFVGDTPWAHLDIANMDMSNKERPLSPKGPTGFGISLLNRWVRELVG